MKQKLLLISKEQAVSQNDIQLVKNLADDLRPKDICNKTGANIRTTEAKIMRMKRKFGCETTNGLVALFFRNKLIN